MKQGENRQEVNKGLSVDRRPNGKKVSHQSQSIDQWKITLPLICQKDMVKQTIMINEQKQENDSGQNIQHLLDQYIKLIKTGNYQSQLLQKIISQAQNLPLSNLWLSQYTNKLSLCISIISGFFLHGKINKKITSQSSQIPNQNLNKDQSNMESYDNQTHKEPTKKKKKICKKGQLVKKSQISSQKHQQNPNHQTVNFNTSIKRSTDQDQSVSDFYKVSQKVQSIQRQIQRVQKLFIQEIQNIHVLPYVQVQQNFNELQSCQKKKAKVSCQTDFPSERITKYHNQQKTLNNPYSTKQKKHLPSQFFDEKQHQPTQYHYDRPNNNYPLINFQYQINQNIPKDYLPQMRQTTHFSNFNQNFMMNQQQLGYQISEQYLKSFPYPSMQMNPSFSHNMNEAFQLLSTGGYENYMMIAPNKIMQGKIKSNESKQINERKKIQIQQDDGVLIEEVDSISDN